MDKINSRVNAEFKENTFYKKRLLCSKTFLQYDLLQGWDENIIYLHTLKFLNLCN